MAKRNQFAFIDCGITDLQTFLAGLRPEVEPIVLESAEAATKQIARALQGRDSVEAIHIVAHGAPGAIDFSAGSLSLETVERYADDLRSIGGALGKDGQIVVWSCSSAADARGSAFIEAVTHAAACHVAASTDVVGAAANGGRWLLDAGPKASEARPPLTARAMHAYAGVMTHVPPTSGDDTLDDTSGNDTINGLGGNDTITVTGGSDLVNGGNDSDRLIISYAASSNAITGGVSSGSLATGYGGQYGDSIATQVSFSAVEHFTITTGAGNDSINLGAGDNFVDTGAGNDFVSLGTNPGSGLVDGGAGVDALSVDLSASTADISANVVTSTFVMPGGGATIQNFEYLSGFFTGSGNDTIIGGAQGIGASTGAGNDTVETGVGNDTIQAGAGDDTVTITGGFDGAGGGAGSDRLIVSYAAFSNGMTSDSFSGSLETGYGGRYVARNDTNVAFEGFEHFTITTGAGNDDVITRGGSDIIDAGGGSDTVTAGAGNDSLNGGLGADEMFGGAGDDIYIVDDSMDAVHENAGEGVDTVFSSVSHTLSPNVEHLVLTGSGDIDATGDGLDNTMVANFGGANDLHGLGGNDSYYVKDLDDVAFENSGEGTDTVFSNVAYTLGANIENLVLTLPHSNTGIGNDLGNTITGNSLDDTLDGGSGDDRLKGGLGDDTLTGGEGNDLLRGGAGVDDMIGGVGDDIYEVDETADTVTELEGQGTDLVNSSAASYALSSFVENMVLTGAAVTGIGNDLANVMTGNGIANVLSGSDGDDKLNGGDGADTLNGDAGNDQLSGGDGDDQLNGGVGDDVLQGGAGSDSLVGGANNDSYYIDGADTVTEEDGGGTDTVYSTAAHTLAAHVERLVLTSATAQFGTGNDLGNVITGNVLDDTLNGGAGSDILKGGLGNDTLDGGADADTLRAGGGDDILIYDAADVLANGEAGSADVLRLLGGGTDLDLGSLAGDELRAIEIIDLNVGGANTLFLSADDVLAISDTDTLRIDGDGADQFFASGVWMSVDGPPEHPGYDTYYSGNATLLVDTDISSNLV